MDASRVMGDSSSLALPTPAFDVNRAIRKGSQNVCRRVGDRWTLQNKIGMGAKGVVWKALDADDSIAAVKEICLKRLDSKQKAEAMVKISFSFFHIFHCFF